MPPFFVFLETEVFAKEGVEEAEDEEEEARKEEIEEEAAKVPLLDHQVPPKTDSETTINAHFSIFKLVLRFEKVPSDQLQSNVRPRTPHRFLIAEKGVEFCNQAEEKPLLPRFLSKTSL